MKERSHGAGAEPFSDRSRAPSQGASVKFGCRVVSTRFRARARRRGSDLGSNRSRGFTQGFCSRIVERVRAVLGGDKVPRVRL
jgi:hypothetical protein